MKIWCRGFADLGTAREIGDRMKDARAMSIAAVLWVALCCSGQGLAAMVIDSSEDIAADYSFNRLRQFVLQDAITESEEYYGFTETPKHQTLEIHASDDPEFEYMAQSPYYKVFFKGKTVRIVVKDAWVEFELGEELETGIISEQEKPKNAELSSTVEQNSLSVVEVFESVDLSYQVDTSLLTEALTIREAKQFEAVIQKISWDRMTPKYEEDGSILFSDGDGKEILRILPPFMRDATGAVCEDLYYGLLETETGYELHKIIEEKGLKWLEEAVYPVVIDPSFQVIEDWWESSGLKLSFQFFKNLNEYVNPGNGHQLTRTETDLIIPGRGLDLVISRLYETPAVFYGATPYDYEAPPVNVGKGWQLDFPYVGSKYLHLWGGTIYKIQWSGNQFENHKGSHFVLTKNGDNTCTLTTASGTVYEFSTAGKLTQIKDLDQNTITFTYADGLLTSITDTIGRTVSLNYTNNRLEKIIYNGAEIKYSYDSNGCLQWMEDFLNRRTSYFYNSGYNVWLLTKIVYHTSGYTTYVYGRFSDGDYHKYYVSDERVFETETSQVRRIDYSYTGSFEEITSSTVTVEDQSNNIQGSHYCIITDGMVTQRIVKNASGTPIRKYVYTYNSRNEVTEEHVYYDGSTLSYTNYYSYDNWGNVIYARNGENHETFFSYANTNTFGFFIDNAGTIIRTFANDFSNSTVPESVHTALLGTAEKQDSTYVREVYITYDSEVHPTQNENLFGNATTWLTFSGTFNEKTGDTSFPIDLTGHTVSGNGVLQITGLLSDQIYTESHSGTCHSQCTRDCKSVSGSWVGGSYKLTYQCCRYAPDDPTYERCFGSSTTYIGPFAHKPGTLGYQSYYTIPSMGEKFSTCTVTTRWKPYPAQVQYNLDNSDWKTITSNLSNGTANITVPITNGSHTLYFSESSPYITKFSWKLYVPVDNSPDTYTTSMQYDTYGNITSITDAESNTLTFTYSSAYSSAYLTETSATVGSDTITTKTTYDYYRGWVTSVQEPKGVEGSGYDTLYTYDVLGRIIKKEFPLLPEQSERSCLEVVYNCENRTVTMIDQLRHYIVQQYDKLGRLTDVRSYTGIYGSGVLYATKSYTYRYDDQIATVTDPSNHTTTYTYDFLGRNTQIEFPDSSSVSYSHDDTANKMTYTNGRGHDRICWFDWLGQLTKVEEEYAVGSFAVTTYQYNEIGNLTSFTDAENHTTSYTFSSLFGLTKITYPDTEYEEFNYDNVGNLISFTDANGNETAYAHDSMHRLTRIQYQDQSTVDFTYDLNSNRTRMDDDAPNTGDYVEYSYDYWNRLTTEARHISQNTCSVSYEYDVANRLTKLTYPDGMQILYSYDDLNRTIEIKQYIDGSNDEILMDDVQYDTESFLAQFDFGNDLQATFSYNLIDRLSSIDVKDGDTLYLDLDYTHDSSGNITQLVNRWRDTGFNWHSQTESYSYDGLDQLTSANSTSWSHTYSYNKIGNRKAEDSVIYTINSVNEVTALSDGTSFTYDANGNRTQKTKGSDTWVYTYDYENRLTRLDKNSVTLGEYVYDGDGKRIQVTEGSKTTTYIYSGLNVLYEENTTGTAVYVYGPTGKLAKKATVEEESHVFYYHTDHLGSTRLVTDESKNIVTDVTYEPFGESVVTGEESYLFTGKEKDSTGLYYYGARYHDPELGYFITRDPFTGKIAVPQSLNRYAYCLNNPLKFIDPAGLTFRICNVGTRVCKRISETRSSNNPKKPEWIAYDKNGDKITDSNQIKELMASEKEEDRAQAVYLMLLVTHPEIEGEYGQVGVPQTEGYMDEGYLFQVTIKRENVYMWIVLKDEFVSEEGYPAHTFLMGLNVKGKMYDMIKLTVYQAAFESFAHLYHVIGHEGVHVYELSTTGKTTEVNAYMWNLDHAYCTVPYPWDIGILMLIYRNEINPFHPPFGSGVPA